MILMNSPAPEADAHVVEGRAPVRRRFVDLGDALESNDGRGLGRCGRVGRDCCVRVHASIVRLRRASPLRRFPDSSRDHQVISGITPYI